MHTPECAGTKSAYAPPDVDECWIAQVAGDAALADGYGNTLATLRLEQLTRAELLACSVSFSGNIDGCLQHFARERRAQYSLSLPLIGRAREIWIVEFPPRHGDGPALRVTTFWDGTAVHIQRPDE